MVSEMVPERLQTFQRDIVRGGHRLHVWGVSERGTRQITLVFWGTGAALSYPLLFGPIAGYGPAPATRHFFLVRAN